MKRASQRRQRILVAVDGSPASLDALDAGARVASAIGAELEGLFVEDTNLLSFSELPFASVTGAHFAPAQKLGRADVERELRAQSQRAQQAVARAGARATVHWSFRVVRGNVQQTVINAAAGVDLLSLGYAGVSETRRACGGSTAHFAIRSAPGSVLVSRQVSGPQAGPVVALPTSENTGQQGIVERAALFAKAVKRQLWVVVPATPSLRNRLIESLTHMLSPLGLEVRWLVPEQRGPNAAFTEAVRSAVGGTLVIEANSPLFEGERIGRLLDRGGCSLLVLRELGNGARSERSAQRRATQPLSSGQL